MESGAPTADETELIWNLIIDDHAVWWMRDFESYARYHTQASSDRWWASITGYGITLNNGWDMIARQARNEMRMDPDPNPLFAYQSRFEKRSLRIFGYVAWATFDCVFPTAGLPGFHGPAVSHEIRILERHGGEWKIALVALMDDQFGQTDVPIWQIEPSGKVIDTNPAAVRFMQAESEFALRNGRVHLLDHEADRRLQQEIARLGQATGGIMAPRASSPVVYDPGNDLPARVWWVNVASGRLYLAFNDPSLLRAGLQRASQAFGLSPAQQRLAAAVVFGLSLTQAARQEGIRPSTAKTQLQRIFEKVGVRSQPSLVRALLTFVEPR